MNRHRHLTPTVIVRIANERLLGLLHLQTTMACALVDGSPLSYYRNPRRRICKFEELGH